MARRVKKSTEASPSGSKTKRKAAPEAATLEAPPQAAAEVSGAKDGDLPVEEPRDDEILILPVRSLVLFPGVVLPLQLERARLAATIEDAMRSERPVGLLLQRDPEQDEPAAADLHETGTVASILRYVESEGEGRLAVCQGQQRFRLIELVAGSSPLRGRIEFLEESGEGADVPEREALFATLKRQGLEALQLMPEAPAQVAQLIEGAKDPGVLADLLVTFMDLPASEKQEVLDALDVGQRLSLVAAKLGHMLQVMRMSKDIQEQTEESLGEAQREYYLRQQLETIRKELGEEDDPRVAELRELEQAIAKAALPEAVAAEAARELERMRRMPAAAAESAMIRTWLDVLVDLPWNESSEDVLDLAAARKILDRDHHGLEPVKRRILEFLAVKKLNPERRGPILCLVGPPGVGKTSLGQSIAKAMGRAFTRISLGGVHDESEIRGHRRTYIGAMPGKIIDALRKVGVNNAVFMLDEMDKLGEGQHGSPSAALLEVLDPGQNGTFQDHYLNLPFDLSRMLFIATANVPDMIPGPLRDRCEMIHLPGYTLEEKLVIARKHLLPRQVKDCGLKRGQLKIGAPVMRRVIADWTREAGVRSLDRRLASLARHAAARIAGGKRGPVTIEEKHLRDILGPQQHQAETALRTSLPGVATGLAWTPFGGELLFIEATKMAGRGGLILTGKLGEVMRESAQAAVSLVKNRAESLGIDPADFASHDVHIHVPAGSIPKDGPSAGVAMFLALTSLFTGRAVRSDVAMTGEISLRGLVLPIGGLREKVLAAQAAGIKTVLLPAANREDYDEVPEAARKRMKVVWLEDVDGARRAGLEPKGPSKSRSSRKR